MAEFLPVPEDGDTIMDSTNTAIVRFTSNPYIELSYVVHRPTEAHNWVTFFDHPLLADYLEEQGVPVLHLPEASPQIVDMYVSYQRQRLEYELGRLAGEAP